MPRINPATSTGLSRPRNLALCFGLLAACAACGASDGSETEDGEEAFNRTDKSTRFDLPLDTAAGETLVDGEEAALDEAAQIVKALLEKKVAATGGAKPVNRANHAVSHGCVDAEFEVLPVEPHLRQGVFAKPATYKTWMRFSNTDGVMSGKKSERDDESVPRGVGIKLLGVPGPQILPSRASVHTQDFLVTNRPVFYFKDIVVFSEGLRVVQKGGLELLSFAVEHPRAALNLLCRVGTDKLDKNRIDNPLNTPYWSKLPHKFGSGEAIKYRIRPCGYDMANPPQVVLPSRPPARYLRGAMQERLSPSLRTDSACFEFEVQRRTHPDKMPIEDGSIDWNIDGKERLAPFEKVGRITIKPQVFSTPERDEFCEGLTFSPWNSVVDHRPLGNLNRARKVIETMSAEYRHQQNGVPMKEPE